MNDKSLQHYPVDLNSTSRRWKRRSQTWYKLIELFSCFQNFNTRKVFWSNNKCLFLSFSTSVVLFITSKCLPTLPQKLPQREEQTLQHKLARVDLLFEDGFLPLLVRVRPRVSQHGVTSLHAHELDVSFTLVWLIYSSAAEASFSQWQSVVCRLHSEDVQHRTPIIERVKKKKKKKDAGVRGGLTPRWQISWAASGAALGAVELNPAALVREEEKRRLWKFGVEFSLCSTHFFR